MRSQSRESKIARSRRGRDNQRRAVTIVELIIVIMIMGIMAAVAAPAFFDSLLHHRVESAARRVKADLELARNTARLKSFSQSVTFTSTGYSLSAAITGLDDSNQAYSVDLAAAPYELSKITAKFGNSPVVSFDGYGTPTSGGTVVLTSQGHQCTLVLDGVTGEVSITSNHVRGGQAAVDGN